MFSIIADWWCIPHPDLDVFLGLEEATGVMQWRIQAAVCCLDQRRESRRVFLLTYPWQHLCDTHESLSDYFETQHVLMHTCVVLGHLPRQF